MGRHAPTPTHPRSSPGRMPTGRLIVWLVFYLIVAVFVMATVVTLAGKGAQ